MTVTEAKTPSTVALWLILLSICGLSTSNYFCYHAPSATSSEFQEVYNLSPQQFGTLFTVYSLPNVVLVFFSGMIIDRYGIVFSSLVFNSLILLGVVLCAIAPPALKTNTDEKPLLLSASYIMLLVGRLFVGLGGESIVACASTMIAKWFTSLGHANAAMSTHQALVQLLGSSAAFYFLPRLNSLFLSLWVTVAVAGFSFACNLAYIFLEHKYENYFLGIKPVRSNSTLSYHSQQRQDSVSDSTPLLVSEELSSFQVNSKDVHTYQSIRDQYPVNTNKSSATSNHTTNRDSYYQHEDTSDIDGHIHDFFSDIDTHSDLHVSNHVPPLLTERRFGVIETLSSFSITYWFLTLHVASVSPILYTFTAFGPLYLLENFNSIKTTQEAGDGISLLYFGIVLAPLSGYLIDRIGNRAVIQFVATLNIFILFVVLKYLTNVNPYFCLFYMGVLFSITEANSMAMMSYIVPSERLGAAYGLTACCISIALIVEPAVVGTLRESTGSYESSAWMFIGMVLLGTLFIFGVYVMQKRQNLVF